jgi:Flp pilus assembly protein TadD
MRRLHWHIFTEAWFSEFGEEIKNNPSYPPSFLFRALALMTRGDWTSALPDLNLAVMKMPDNSKALVTRARCFNQMGKFPEAEGDFRRALELDPSNPETLNGLARLLSITGRNQESETLFEKARELNKNIRNGTPSEIQFGGPAKREE